MERITNRLIGKKVDTGAAKRFIEAALNNGTGNSTVITGTPEPAISSVTFQGKHTKFEQDDSDDESKITKQDEKNIRKSSTKLSKKDKSTDKVTKPKKEKKSKHSK